MRNFLWCDCGARVRDLAPLVLRIATGLVFLMHGWQKYTMMGVPGVTDLLTTIGFPFPAFFAIVLLVVEIAGGALLILGAFTHWAAKLLAIVALVATVTVHLPHGFYAATGGYEFTLLLLAAAVSLMLTGPGKWSVDRMVFKK